MMKITIEGIEITMGKPYGVDMYRKGGMICHVAPWLASGCPITLGICICPDGTILNRGWEWTGNANGYLHTSDKREDLQVTEQMAETVSALWSGRILIDGVNIKVGVTVQKICQVDIEKEEELLGKKIYLA